MRTLDTVTDIRSPDGKLLPKLSLVRTPSSPLSLPYGEARGVSCAPDAPAASICCARANTSNDACIGCDPSKQLRPSTVSDSEDALCQLRPRTAEPEPLTSARSARFSGEGRCLTGSGTNAMARGSSSQTARWGRAGSNVTVVVTEVECAVESILCVHVFRTLMGVVCLRMADLTASRVRSGLPRAMYACVGWLLEEWCAETLADAPSNASSVGWLEGEHVGSPLCGDPCTTTGLNFGDAPTSAIVISADGDKVCASISGSGSIAAPLFEVLAIGTDRSIFSCSCAQAALPCDCSLANNPRLTCRRFPSAWRQTLPRKFGGIPSRDSFRMLFGGACAVNGSH